MINTLDDVNMAFKMQLRAYDDCLSAHMGDKSVELAGIVESLAWLHLGRAKLSLEADEAGKNIDAAVEDLLSAFEKFEESWAIFSLFSEHLHFYGTDLQSVNQDIVEGLEIVGGIKLRVYERLFSEAAELHGQQQFAAAERQYRQCVKLLAVEIGNPNELREMSLKVYANLSDVLLQQNKLQEAEKILRESQKVGLSGGGKAAGLIMANFGDLYKGLGLVEKAQESYGSAIQHFRGERLFKLMREAEKRLETLSVSGSSGYKGNRPEIVRKRICDEAALQHHETRDY